MGPPARRLERMGLSLSGDIKAVPVLEGETIVTLLPVCSFDSKERGEQGHLGQGLSQTVLPRFRQQPIWIDPRIKLARLGSGGIDNVEPFHIEIPHLLFSSARRS